MERGIYFLYILNSQKCFFCGKSLQLLTNLNIYFLENKEIWDDYFNIYAKLSSFKEYFTHLVPTIDDQSLEVQNAWDGVESARECWERI